MGFVTYWVCRLKGCTYWVYRIMWVSLNSFELLQYEVCLIMEFCRGIKKITLPLQYKRSRSFLQCWGFYDLTVYPAALQTSLSKS